MNCDEQLLHAVKTGNINLLKENNSRLSNLRDFLGHTPLTLSIIHGHAEIVDFLLENTINNINSVNNVTKLFQSLCGGMKAQFLTKYHNNDSFWGETALICAIRKSDFEIIKSLVRNGADVNLCDSQDLTPLYYAILRRCSMYIIRFLLFCGADFHIAKHKLDEYANCHKDFNIYWSIVKPKLEAISHNAQG